MLFFAPMASIDFPISHYLQRVGLGSPPDPDEAGLRQIHLSQAFSIPFENIDVHLGRSISLKPEDLTRKMLQKKRGGYCFEQNGLLRLALASLGFDVRPHMARVLYGRPGPGARTHQVLIVTISGEKWLADTGFGGPGLRLPMRMVADQVQEQHGECYRLRRDRELGMVLQKQARDLFIDLYVFDEDELTLDIDIDMANHFTSTWPDSIFVLRRMCSLAQPWGCVTLSDMELTIYRDGQSVSLVLPPGPEYMAALAEHFGIEIDARYEDLAPLKNV